MAGTYTVRGGRLELERGSDPDGDGTDIGRLGGQAGLHFDARHRHGFETANAGPITVQEQDAFGNPTFSPVTVNLTSSSAAGVFSLTSGGAPVTSVTIPGGAVSSVAFYYGDTVAGTPTITASAPPLASNTQVETIQPGPAASFSLSTPSPTTGTAFPETITALDAFGNVATSYTRDQVCDLQRSRQLTKRHRSVVSGQGGTCATGSSSVTFTNGVANPSITLFKAGSTTLTATQGALTGSATFNVATGSFGTLTVANPGPQTAGVTVQRHPHRGRRLRQPLHGDREPDLQWPCQRAERHGAQLPGDGDLHQRDGDSAGHPV